VTGEATAATTVHGLTGLTGRRPQLRRRRLLARPDFVDRTETFFHAPQKTFAKVPLK
jgi:hypothetical protein